MPSHGSSAKVYANGWDLSSYLNSANIVGPVDVVDVSAFSNTFKNVVGGLRDATLTAGGFFDTGTGGTTGVDYVLWNALGGGSIVIWSYFPAGDVSTSSVGYGIRTVETTYDISSDVGDAVKVSAMGQAARVLSERSAAERFITHLPLTASISTAGTGGTVDGAAASTGGGAAFMHVTALNGGTVAGTVQDSADGSTGWTAIATFANVTAAHQAQRVEMTGTVRRYTRAVWNVTSGTATISIGFGRD